MRIELFILKNIEPGQFSLKPDTFMSGYRNLEFDVEFESELRVIGEFVVVIE